jgi:PAS domain S-box-containing protein
MADARAQPPADPTDSQQTEVDRARLAAIIDSSDDAIVSKTLDGVIITWNRSAERIFGWSAAEAVGRHITMMIPEERRFEEDEVLARLRRGETVDHFETVRVTKSGERRNISLTVSPIRNAAGRIIGASKIARDITERRRMEEERERLLAREREARAQAEALNRTKDVFLATVSHELRTPLNAIFGWARLLQTTEMDEATRTHAVGAIVRGAAAQAQLIEDLLDLSRIVTGRMRLDFGRLDLGVVIEAAVDTVRPAAAAKEIALTTALDVSVGPTVGAADRLQQVVWNLVSNAVKFTPRGGRVEVSLRRVNGSAEIVVTDTGEGIAPEVLPYVFDQFRQEDSSSTRAHGGLGLGLALVRHLVELHGGQVRAHSPGKGKGASFTATLPLVPVHGERERRPAARGEPAPAKSALGGGGDALRDLRVLVVDDDADALDVASMLLRDRGADVRSATSAFRAFDIVKTWEPEVLVSDLAIPGEDGFMLLRALRGAVGSGRSRLPAIAVTAYKTAENQKRALEAGFDLYLTKPVDPLQLTAAVAEVARRAE